MNNSSRCVAPPESPGSAAGSLRSFRFEPAHIREFIDFGYALYAGDRRRVPPFRREIARQLSPGFYFYRKAGNDHRHFLVYRSGRVAGRITAMINADITDEQRRPVGLVGFYECIDDDEVAAKLLDAAGEWLRKEHGVRRIRGPMNFDFWHGYRFLVKGFDQAPYYGEPDNKSYYPEQFERCGFAPLRFWNSIEVRGRELLESLIAPSKEKRESLEERGYRFIPAARLNLRKTMPVLVDMIFRSFGEIPDFTPIPHAELKALLSGIRFALAAPLSSLLRDKTGRAVGFAVVFLDLADAVRQMNGRVTPLRALRFLRLRRKSRRLNFFAAGSLPEERFRRLGAGRAGLHTTIREALDRGYDDIVFAQMGRDEYLQTFFRHLKIEPQREYILYERDA